MHHQHKQMTLRLVLFSVCLVLSVLVIEGFIFNPHQHSSLHFATISAFTPPIVEYRSSSSSRGGSHVLNAHRRRNHYYRSSSARNNANSTEFEMLASSATATATATISLQNFRKFGKGVGNVNLTDNDTKIIKEKLDKEQQPRNKAFFIPFATSSTAVTTQGPSTIVAQNDATITKATTIINSSSSRRSRRSTSSNSQSYSINLFKTAESNASNNNNTSTIFSSTETLAINTNSTDNQNDNGNTNDGKNNTEDVEVFTVQNPNTICRIVASADYKIPSLSVQQQQGGHELLTDIDAITHARIHSQTQNQFQYMESIEREYRIGQSSSLPLSSSLSEQASDEYSEQKEEKLSQTLRRSLEDSGFQLLSIRDIELCEALNSEYLLRLSILPDVSELDPSIGREFYPELYRNDGSGSGNDKKNGSTVALTNEGDIVNIEKNTAIAMEDNGGVAFGQSQKQMMNEVNNDNSNNNDNINEKKARVSNIKSSNNGDDNGLLYDGRILVYRRGYSEEVTTGRLLLPKFDYLQSSFVQRIASNFARQIGDVEKKISDSIVEFVNKIVQNILNEMPQGLRIFVKKRTGIDQDKGVANGNYKAFGNNKVGDTTGTKRGALGRYRSGKFVDSTDNNDALSPFLVCELTDINADETDVDKDLYDVLNAGSLACQRDLNQKGRPRNNEQAQLLKRVSIANLVDFFSVGGRRRLVKSLFAESELVEPTYDEVILIWRPLPDKKKIRRGIKLPQIMYDIAEIFEVENRLPEKPTTEQRRMPLEIRAFSNVPMANLLAVFPKTKLIFRPADAFIFDLINITTFLAVLSSVRFDSPKLDLLALVSGVLWVLRTFFRYSNKLARYDLLVNKFLTSRISHRNSGALRYLVDEAAVQRARRASLVHEWLVQYVGQQPVGAILTRDHILRNGVFGINEMYQLPQPIQLDLNAALVDLVDLELISFSDDESKILFEVKVGEIAKQSLKGVWNGMFL